MAASKEPQWNLNLELDTQLCSRSWKTFIQNRAVICNYTNNYNSHGAYYGYTVGTQGILLVYGGHTVGMLWANWAYYGHIVGILWRDCGNNEKKLGRCAYCGQGAYCGHTADTLWAYLTKKESNFGGNWSRLKTRLETQTSIPYAPINTQMHSYTWSSV